MGKFEEQQEQKNRDKYGAKEDDVIARAYREDKRTGDIWCAKNAEKYLRRFISTSEKSNNLMDLYKVKDYIGRMIEENEKIATFLKTEEIVEKLN